MDIKKVNKSLQLKSPAGQREELTALEKPSAAIKQSLIRKPATKPAAPKHTAVKNGISTPSKSDRFCTFELYVADWLFTCGRGRRSEES
jgi:hypothetical protein